ncbi:type II CRISPR-associated endonuclease Cas1 [Companilactobacillus hulinensis]|uniref:type II CRISPR-associated endonuclease Cas1 n=1 Tax=Companilactobacillus hulinensis TaxID=2486007 RepID=UPI000F79DF24|nr:type II CRISPR-associated endonuclease Cas1 [Companilactobacillus hulinensis]
MGWKTYYIAQKSKLSYKENHVIVQQLVETKSLPFNQIGCLVLASTQIVITGYLVSKLAEANIRVIFCDTDRNPCAELCTYYTNEKRNQNIDTQISWSITQKERLWTQIVTNKIENQINILQQNTLDISGVNKELEEIKENDRTNREAAVARKYFPLLFGSNFSRGKKEEKINIMLNYGYTVMLSAANQIVSSQGYLTQLGIHHHSLKNDFNLSCDFIEPFRQFIDIKVIELKDQDFDEHIKKELIQVMDQTVHYDGKDYILSNAMDQYIRDCFKFLDLKKDSIGKVGFINEA